MKLPNYFRGNSGQKLNSSVNIASIAGTTSGNHYGIETDRTYYAKLCYTGVVIDEKINIDVEYFKNHYFTQDCTCLSMWFKGEDASPYIQDKNFIFAPTYNYFCFFNAPTMQAARTQDGSAIIYYPKSLTECHFFQTVGPSGVTQNYQVLRDKAKLVSATPDLNYMIAQFLGYVVRQKQGMNNEIQNVVEFIFAYALDIL